MVRLSLYELGNQSAMGTSSLPLSDASFSCNSRFKNLSSIGEKEGPLQPLQISSRSLKKSHDNKRGKLIL